MTGTAKRGYWKQKISQRVYLKNFFYVTCCVFIIVNLRLSIVLLMMILTNILPGSRYILFNFIIPSFTWCMCNCLCFSVSWQYWTNAESRVSAWACTVCLYTCLHRFLFLLIHCSHDSVKESNRVSNNRLKHLAESAVSFCRLLSFVIKLFIVII